MTPEFDMDAFVHDFKSSFSSDALVMMSMLHHLWESCPLKLSTGVALIAFSPSLVIDISDIKHIYIDDEGDFRVVFKSGNDRYGGDSCYIEAGTPAFATLQQFIAKLPTSIANEH